MEKPTGKRLPTALPQTSEIDSADFHIPSAPTASMNRIQIPKGQNPLRLPFASFRLIFGLEKTAPLPGPKSHDLAHPVGSVCGRKPNLDQMLANLVSRQNSIRTKDGPDS